MAGGAVRKTIRQELTYNELDDSIDNLWSVLFLTGYLSVQEETEGRELLLTIPNLEIREIFVTQIQEWFREVSWRDKPGMDAFCLAFRNGDAEAVEEQFQAYKQVVQTMGKKKVIIRTLDIGADKQADYFELGKEDNPALGYRAIRICLKQPEIFKTQLRALLRAAAYGNLSIMYPMIISVEEVKQIYAIVDEVEEELKQAQIPYRIPEQGIMIETPAAVMVSDELAALVDFFSIGTNDLTQYTLAIDRQNQRLEDFYNPHHKAILRMIQMVVDNAHKCGKWAGICGELGADLELTEEFVKMGIDELSVSPSMVLPLRKCIREIS